MYFGCAWYPEHWDDESTWAADLELMREAGMNVVRVGEFAWSRLEPRDGVFALDWLARAVDLAAEHGIGTVLGTPTAAPPAWLTAAHGEVLRVNPNGQPAGHGARGHFNPASEVYLAYCRRIAGEMAKRFGRCGHVIGWQIDNEYWPFSYDAGTRAKFHQFLRDKYGTLENLNRRWSAAYWSQEYSDWSQVPMSTEWQNPCLVLDLRRFITEVQRRYQHNQAEAIRAHAEGRQFITHNFHGDFGHFDHYIVAGELEFASYDPYVGSGHLDFGSQGFRTDLARGFNRRNIWIMETQPGSVNWSGVNNPLDRGEVRQMAWHLVGHGSDAVLYWQWRSAPGGQEQYHGCIVAPSGRPRPLYAEVQRIGREFAAAAAALDGTTVRAQAAMLFSFDDRWSVNAQKHHRDFDVNDHMLGYYRPLHAAGLDVDVVSPLAALDGYRLVVAPNLHLMDDALACRLVEYVVGGGHLVLGARSGFKDVYNALLPAEPPGPVLASALGGHVAEYYALEAEVQLAAGAGFAAGASPGKAALFAEWLVADAADTQVLVRYRGHNWLDGQPAAITRELGKGRISYVGFVGDAAAMEALIAWAIDISGCVALAEDLDEGVEVCRRVAPGREVLIVINHTPQMRSCRLRAAMRNVLTAAPVGREVSLPPREVLVLV
jgi:beta-galactosidase